MENKKIKTEINSINENNTKKETKSKFIQNKNRYEENKKPLKEIKNKDLKENSNITKKKNEVKVNTKSKSQILYIKGKEYIIASSLLKQKKNKETAVTLELFCEGFELISKSLLLFNNYSKFEPLLKEDIRHDLEKCYNYSKEYIDNINSDLIYAELKVLNEFYAQNRMKFVTSYDNLNNFETIKIQNLIKLSEKILKIIETKFQTN